MDDHQIAVLAQTLEEAEDGHYDDDPREAVRAVIRRLDVECAVNEHRDGGVIDG